MRHLFLAILARDLRLAARRRVDSLLPVVFFLVAVSLFPLGVGPEPQTLRQIAPGIVWVCALLATMLSVNTLYAGDMADGSLEQMLRAPASGIAVALAKATAHWLVAGLPTSRGPGPWARIVDGMRAGSIEFVTSDALVREYRGVLARPAIASRLRLGEGGVEALLDDTFHLPHEGPRRQHALTNEGQIEPLLPVFSPPDDALLGDLHVVEEDLSRG